MLDAMILSDLHLGSNTCRVDLLEGFLTHLPATQRLILNGDVLENTSSRLSKRHWKILSLLRKLSDHLELIWVEGNHDRGAAPVAHLIGANYQKELVFLSGEKLVLCIHGDRFDDFITNRPWITWIADKIYGGLQSVSPRFARLVKLTSKVYLRCCTQIRTRSIAYARQKQVSVVCCGHTHRWETPSFSSLDIFSPPEYYNSGCWTEDQCHYLEVKNGEVELKSCSPRPQTSTPILEVV